MSTTLKRKAHLNLSGSHHTLDSDNAFIGGFLYATGSISASVGVSGSQVQATELTASFGAFNTISGSRALGGPLGTGLLIETSVLVTQSFVAVDGGGVLVGLGQDGTFGADSGSLNGSPTAGFKVVPSATPGNVDLFLNGANLGAEVTPITASVNTTIGTPHAALDFGFNFANVLTDKGMGKITLNILAHTDNGDSYAAWTHVLTIVSSAANTSFPLGVAELDYVTSGSGTAFDVNYYSDCSVGVTGSVSNGTEWYAKVSNIMFFTTTSNKPY
jgi:hypothetical protein